MDLSRKKRLEIPSLRSTKISRLNEQVCSFELRGKFWSKFSESQLGKRKFVLVSKRKLLENFVFGRKNFPQRVVKLMRFLRLPKIVGKSEKVKILTI